jgi:predicted peptidase
LKYEISRAHALFWSLGRGVLILCAVPLLSGCTLIGANNGAHEVVRAQAPYKQVHQENERKIADAPVAAFTSASFTATNDVTVVYRLFTPPAPTRERLPLVVMMHGSGQIGTDNQKQLGWLARSWVHPDIRSRFPAYVLVPQVPRRSADYEPVSDAGVQRSVPRPPLEAVMQLVEHTIKNHNVDASRVYIIGFSMGASGAWNALLLRPHLFAAALPIAGVAPDRTLAPMIARTPVMIVHGSADNENPIASDRAMFAALGALPNSQVQLKEIDGLDHSVPAEMVFATAWREWLFAQRRGK